MSCSALFFYGLLGSTMCWRESLMTVMGFLTPFSAPKITTKRELISASNAWWLFSATAQWPIRFSRWECQLKNERLCMWMGLFLIYKNYWFYVSQSNGDLKRKWTWAVEWLGDELERRPYTGNTQYTYNNWSPPVQSNETSNGYFLERSHSARMTLAKACELCPEEVCDIMPPLIVCKH